MIGERFGNLVVLKEASGKTHHKYYLCQCDCGRKHKARGALLTDGSTKRCRECATAAANKTKKKPPKETLAEAVYRHAAKHHAKGVKQMKWLMNLALKEMSR